MGKRGNVRVGDYICLYRNLTGFFFTHHTIVSADKTEFVSVRVPQIVLSGRWRNSIVLSVHAPGEEICDESEGNF